MSELNKRAAELMGWREVDLIVHEEKCDPPCFVVADGELETVIVVFEDGSVIRGFNPEHNPAHARMLEDRIAEINVDRDGTIREYVFNLMTITDGFGFNHTKDIWRGIRATPQQRTQAFIATMEERE